MQDLMMDPQEAAVAYLAVDVADGQDVTGLSRADAVEVAEFARRVLGYDAVVRRSVGARPAAYTVTH